MSRLFFFLLAAGTLCLRTLEAQDIRPREPILPRMPERSAWILQFARTTPEAPATRPPKAPATTRITITKDGTTYRLVSDQPIGGSKEAWVIGQRLFLLSPDGSSCVIADPSVFPASDFSQSDFEPFEWVRSTNFSGLANLEKRMVFVFETGSLQRALSRREQSLVSGVRQTLGGEDPAASRQAFSEEAVLKMLGWANSIRAMLDAETQRPVRQEYGDEVIQVYYLPDTKALAVPPPIQARLTAISRESRALERRPTRPK